jgi:thiol-disulfide isomerase/thioredoxin
MSSSRSVTAALATSIALVVSVLAVHHVHQQRAARRRRGRLDEEAERQQQPAAAIVKRQPVELSSREEWVTTYPSLNGAFNSSASSSPSPTDGLVGILFAAGWCDDCQAFVPLLQTFVELNQKLEREGQDGSRRSLNVVYVSSDRSREEMEQFKPAAWMEVPYEQAQERIQLKRHFGACAKKELDDPILGMTVHDRRHGIPTLVLVETSTGQIVSENGVDMVAKAMKEAMIDGGAHNDESENVEGIARVAIDRFWRDLSLLQEQ